MGQMDQTPAPTQRPVDWRPGRDDRWSRLAAMGQPTPNASESGASIDLRGPGLRLRTTTETDREALIAIRRTPEVAARWRSEDLEADFDELLDDAASGEVQPLTLVDRDGQVVGFIQFAEEEDPDYRHASIDIYVDPARHRRGHATEAIGVVIDHLFEDRGHHRLTIDPAADNEGAIACYAGLGFQAVGVLRAYERQADGRWADGLLMELLDTDPRPTI